MMLRLSPAILLGLLACAPTQKATSEDVVFTATDFAFSGPDSIAPGVHTIRFVNHGTQDHHLILGRLAEGKTLQDLMAFMQTNPTAEPPGMSWHGAAGAVAPGDSTGSIADLPAGRYVLICFITDPADHQAHMVKGMIKEVTVAGEPLATKAPHSAGDIRLSDFNITVPTLTAGHQTLRLVNDGPQTHEAQLVRLNDGVTAEQFLGALSPDATSPPPGVLLGGTGALSPGLENYWSVAFTPGKYLLVCFVPDTASGVPHVMKGMVREFSIPSS